MWFIHDPQRLTQETADIEALRDKSPWLETTTPCMKGLQFGVEFTLTINGENVPFTLVYPAFFPDTPPSVFPRDGEQHSSHQWGSGGELCLEFRTDNWDPTFTGAMLIESTYRLLSGECPAEDQRAAVPSSHRSSIGQRLRSAQFRAFLTQGLKDVASTLSPGTAYPCRIVENYRQRHTTSAFVSSVGSAQAPIWTEDSIPHAYSQTSPGLLVRLETLQNVVITDQKQLDLTLENIEFQAEAVLSSDAKWRPIVLTDASTMQFYVSFFHDGTWRLVPYGIIDVSGGSNARLPDSHTVLRDKKVGLIGCGSLGSKIAASLARSGVNQFVVVDEDIFKPGNLVRNDLGAESLGAHKAEALDDRLNALAVDVNVDARRTYLGGQESSGSAARTLEALARCDLLIDATADSQVFNLVASVALRSRRSMIWAEVYAGGIGGFIARVRPDIEPPPHTARQQYLAWCRDQGVPWDSRGDHYEIHRDDAPPIIADDAAVGVIAAHTVRMAMDVLIHGDTSAFPHPAYAVGLANEWIFEEPFDTRPIDFSTEGKWTMPISDEGIDSAISNLISLLEQTDDAGRTST